MTPQWERRPRRESAEPRIRPEGRPPTPGTVPLNPFDAPGLFTARNPAQTVDDRLAMLRTFSAERCLQALRIPRLQPTVRRALRRRLQELGIDLEMLGAPRLKERGR